MTRSLLGRLRRLWLDVHLWIGVGLLVLLIPLGLSGSVLVWHDAVDRAIHADRYAVTGPAGLPPSAYMEAAREAFGERAIPATLRLPHEAGDPVTVVGPKTGPRPQGGRTPQLTAWLDPTSAKVLDVADIRGGFTGTMHRLHGSLLITAPGVGRKVVGWLGVAMTVSCLTGLWLWWPRNGKVLKAMRWRRSPSFLNNLHHMAGLWILIPLLTVSLTGVYISFPQTARALFGIEQGPPRGARPAAPSPLAATNLSPDIAVEKALAAHSGTLATLELPAAGRHARWKVEMADGARLTVDDLTGEVAPSRERERRGGGPDALSRLMRQIHDGGETPFVWQVLVFLTGLAPPVLGISGLVMWLRRRKRRLLIRQGHDV